MKVSEACKAIMGKRLYEVFMDLCGPAVTFDVALKRAHRAPEFEQADEHVKVIKSAAEKLNEVPPHELLR